MSRSRRELAGIGGNEQEQTGNEQELKELTGVHNREYELPPSPGGGRRLRSLWLATRFVAVVFPGVEGELRQWRQRLERAGDPELRRQGLDSIGKKRFHAQGGGVYALLADAPVARRLISFIVAFQTISDYLDNLCDRLAPGPAEGQPPVQGNRRPGRPPDHAAFRQLHLAFTDALNPGGDTADYYRAYPYSDDGGYLQALVERCRQVLLTLPSYPAVREETLRLGGLYSDLQTFKHADPRLRQDLLQDWFAVHAAACPGLDWWEFAAATGSTLGIFALCAAAAGPRLAPETVSRLSAGYFPWISGLHIMLDYFIDQAEDEEAGDLNFVSCYADDGRRRERLLLFLNRALACAAGLPDASFHATVVRGLPAFYLSDPKADLPALGRTAAALLSAGGRETLSMYRACRVLRRIGQL